MDVDELGATDSSAYLFMIDKGAHRAMSTAEPFAATLLGILAVIMQTTSLSSGPTIMKPSAKRSRYFYM